ncbi:MAG: archease [Nitrospinaceae bacterium]
MAEDRWEHFPHEADIGIRGHGGTLEGAFEQAARALTAVVTREKVAPEMSVNIHCEAPDPELLFVDWLNALIFEMATRNMLFSRFEVKIENHRLTGLAWGEAVDVVRHQPAVEVKGATFTELAVHGEAGAGWVAQCVVDV